MSTTTTNINTPIITNFIVDRDYLILPEFREVEVVPPTTPLVNIRVNSSPTSGGEVSIKRTTISKPLEETSYATTQARSYEIGDSILLEAITKSGYSFVRWDITRSSGNGIDSGISRSIPTITVVLTDILFPQLTANETITFTAVFQQPVPEDQSGPTPPPADTPAPTQSTSEPTPAPTVVRATPTPTPTPVIIQPTPTPTPELWRSCIDGKLYPKPIPAGYRSAEYSGAGGGVCWEPVTQVGIHPNINDTVFTYRRGSGTFPTAKKFTLDNPSYALSYSIRILTNEQLFRVEPTEFQLPPREKREFTISTREDTIETFGDGATIFDLQLEILEIE